MGPDDIDWFVWDVLIISRTLFVAGGVGTLCLMDSSTEAANSKSLASLPLLCCIMVTVNCG
jgi:hypothetical protein